MRKIEDKGAKWLARQAADPEIAAAMAEVREQNRKEERAWEAGRCVITTTMREMRERVEEMKEDGWRVTEMSKPTLEGMGPVTFTFVRP